MSHSDHVYRVTGIITSILAILSICGALWLIITSYRKKKNDKENRDFLVNDYVFYMSIWDLLNSSIILLYWSAVGFDFSWHWENHQEVCKILGFIFQLSFVSGVTWSFFIVVNLFRLLAGATNDDLKSKIWLERGKCKIMNNHVIVWTVAIILSLIPITHYGEANLQEKLHYECWIHDKGFQMTLYIPLSVYLITTFYIFCWIGCRKCNLVPKGDTRAEPLQNKLFAFSVLFFSIYLFPTMARIWDFINNGNTPIVFVVLHHILVSCIGLGNFLVWIVIYPIALQTQESEMLISVNGDHDFRP
eukprot:26020_1